MCSRILFPALFLTVAWTLPAHATPEESPGALVSSVEGDNGTSAGAGDWDWEDIDLSGEPQAQTPARTPEPPPVEGEAEWDWDDLDLEQDTEAGAPAPELENMAPPPSKPADPPMTDRPVAEAPAVETGREALDREMVSSPESPDDQTRPSTANAAKIEPVSEAVGAQDDPPAAAADDWDWDDIEEAAAEPVIKTTRRTKREDRMAALAKRPRPGSTAEPDFEAPFDQGYALFPSVEPFQVIPSKKDRDMHPCLDCHEWAESDLTPRRLKEPHDNFRLKHGLHGKGEFWCFTCHHLEGDGGLRTLEGLKLSFDEAYIVCTQCHSQESRDWYFGAHGKRMENWRGTRKLLNCTACHYQHRPNLDARKPLAGPTMRMGMEKPEHWVPKRERSHRTAHRKPIWERYAGKDGEHGHE